VPPFGAAWAQKLKRCRVCEPCTRKRGEVCEGDFDEEGEPMLPEGVSVGDACLAETVQARN